MAEKVAKSMVYTIPLRKGFQKVPKYKRAKKTIAVLREFLKRHTKATEIKLGNYLNKAVWMHGMRNPPHKLKVTVTKDDKGIAHAELFGAKEATPETKQRKTAGKEKMKTAEDKTATQGTEAVREEQQTTPSSAVKSS
ncbi:60S ribosomal protein L31 [Candidatus Woesearchaeota archaeon]|nr:60S ribosomal protein L31 [Candidatus Woesearchaeota archaeon]